MSTPPGDPPRRLFRGARNGEADPWRANPFYRLRLGETGPDRIAQFGHDPRMGDIHRGRELFRGHWRIAAERLAAEEIIPWRANAPSRHFAARLHAFAWLIDLAALGPDAHARIAALIETWVEAFGEWDDLAWDTELAAERLFAWLCHGRVAFEIGDAAQRPALMRSAGRHARLLLIAHNDLDDRPLARIKAGAALVLAGAAQFPDAARLTEEGEEILIEALAKQFLPDGAHQSRAPEQLAEALFDIVAACDALTRGGRDLPPSIRDALPRLANMLRFFRLGDGALACFQGGSENSAGSLDRALNAVKGPVRGFQFATHAAYQRLVAGDLTMLFDVGPAPPFAFAERAHAGALAFEMSCGGERLIVNVGAARELEPEGRAAARTTNAHSTLVVNDALSAALEQRGRGAPRFSGPVLDDVRRSEDEDGVTVQGRHDGYRTQFGLLHRRYLFVDHAGRNVRGIDELMRPMRLKSAASKQPIPFAARFHLHPRVRAEIIEHQMVALETPGGARWRLRTDAPAVTLAQSAYWGGRVLPQETMQIVLQGAADPMGHGLGPPNRIRWALARSD
ncbi:MAG: heparinase II/III family protein [Hyphomonadaceae bacterium]